MNDTHYIVKREQGGKTIYYVGNGAWTFKPELATPYPGEQASVICENLHDRFPRVHFTKVEAAYAARS